MGKYNVDLLNSTHTRLQDNKVDECQFCQNIATLMIYNLRNKPTFLMCEQHALIFIKGLLDDLTTTKGSNVVKELIGEQQEQKKMERQALHVK